MMFAQQRLAFVTTTPSSFGHNTRLRCTCSPRALGKSSLHGISLPITIRASTMNRRPTMVFGGGGFLGVGAPEVLVIIAVGWFVLGPKQLIQLSRDIGQIIGELRKTTSAARDSFTDAIETDIAIKEARKIATPVEGPALPDQDRPVLETDEELMMKNDVIQAATQQAQQQAEQQQGPTRAGDKFMEQLKRVADPDQTSILTPNIPDLELSDEDEIIMLEERLRLAKERVKNKGTPSSTSLNGTENNDNTSS